jgi:hypothetical protein
MGCRNSPLIVRADGARAPFLADSARTERTYPGLAGIAEARLDIPLLSEKPEIMNIFNDLLIVSVAPMRYLLNSSWIRGASGICASNDWRYRTERRM